MSSNTVIQQQSIVEKVPPLLKWAGGKRLLAREIVQHFPSNAGCYFEPFLGGAAIFLASSYSTARLSDVNEELINFYKCVRDRPEALIDQVKLLKNNKTAYYGERRKGLKGDGVAEAARFLYLTTLSFNGIYRQNLSGAFNVPYGGRKRSGWFHEEAIFTVSNRLQSVELMAGDFEQALAPASKGDMVYLDPPYTVAHSNNGFVKYNAKIFSWNDQIRLAALAKSLAERGCRVVVSNADHDSIRCLYEGFSEYKVSRASVMAASSEYRRTITESVFVSRAM